MLLLMKCGWCGGTKVSKIRIRIGNNRAPKGAGSHGESFAATVDANGAVKAVAGAGVKTEADLHSAADNVSVIPSARVVTKTCRIFIRV